MNTATHRTLNPIPDFWSKINVAAYLYNIMIYINLSLIYYHIFILAE